MINWIGMCIGFAIVCCFMMGIIVGMALEEENK